MNKLPILLNEIELSKWAYEYCKNIKNEPEIRKLITDSFFAYLYCKEIKDDEEVEKNINEIEWIYSYCLYKNDYSKLNDYKGLKK